MIEAIPQPVLDYFFDLKAKEFREALFELAACEQIDETVAMAGLAEVAGIVAAQLDERDGTNLFADRMHSFCERAEATYKRRRFKLVTK